VADKDGFRVKLLATLVVEQDSFLLLLALNLNSPSFVDSFLTKLGPVRNDRPNQIRVAVYQARILENFREALLQKTIASVSSVEITVLTGGKRLVRIVIRLFVTVSYSRRELLSTSLGLTSVSVVDCRLAFPARVELNLLVEELLLLNKKN
jgi:hypothetical protein